MAEKLIFIILAGVLTLIHEGFKPKQTHKGRIDAYGDPCETPKRPIIIDLLSHPCSYLCRKGNKLMAIKEIRENELLHNIRTTGSKKAVFFYTTFCGTCHLAERMLGIVEAAGISTDLFKLNINYAPALCNSWKISSVPCLAIVENGQPSRIEYAMQSVSHLYQLLK